MLYSKFLGSHSILAGAILLAAAPAFAQEAVINEIFYHPTGTNLLEQWFELHNPGAVALDLSGWRIGGGVDFIFPTGTSIEASAYLAVAANSSVFSEIHPGIANAVGGWTGTLRHHLRLEDADGKEVDAVAFYGDGDWAARILGPEHYNHRGWEWRADHDGLGHSLELINPAMPNQYAHNWSSSLEPGGTPGLPNSIASSDADPFILQPAHRPVIPQPDDSVTVSARLLDENQAGLSATLYWRIDGAPDFNADPMRDDGEGADDVAGDGLFACELPPQPNGTVVEFYMEARDAAGHSRLYPDYEPPEGSTRTANMLYQVDDGIYDGSQPIYRIVMPEDERAELREIGRDFPDADSDASMNATWITRDGVITDGATTQLRYNCGVRNRGHGTRRADPNNYHVDIPGDRQWKGRRGINLNSHYAHSQVLGSAIFRRLGIPMPDSRPVQVRVNRENLMQDRGDSYGSYSANEQYNNDFVQRSWPRDPDGNSYRGIRDPTEDINSEADLQWHGEDPSVGEYSEAYFKENNFPENDWSDLIELIGVLNEIPGYSSPETYVEDVRRVVDVEEWMKYMAVNTLLDNGETCLANGYGDDYALYRGARDRRFWVLPYDLDTVMGRGQTVSPPGNDIWRMTDLSVLDRFMKTPEFAPIYLGALKTFAETAFSPARMNPLLDHTLGGYVPKNVIETMKAFNSRQVDLVLSQIPLDLTASHGLNLSNGYPVTGQNLADLQGTANAIEARRVLVNGMEAAWTAWTGEWTADGVPLEPGVNRVLIQALGEDGEETGRMELDVWRNDRSPQAVGGTLLSDAFWSAANGPYQVASDLTVANGATLEIEPGATVYLDSGVDVDVDNGGKLMAEGEPYRPIRFTRPPGTSARWGGITVHGGDGSPETRISYARFEFNDSTAIHSSGGAVLLDHLAFDSTDRQYVSLDESSFVVRDCIFPTATSGFELAHGTGGIKYGGRGIFLRNFFGAAQGYNDVVDFTGGNRPGPIVQFIENVFTGSGDDHLDLDSTDAWVEGNIFLHAHKNGSPDTASGVSGGADNADTSEITLLGNIFYDCDQAAMAKQGNFYTLINNTVVRQTHEGGEDTDGAVVALADEGTSEAAGMYLEGNIFYDVEKLTRLRSSSEATFINNLMPLPWTGPGGENSADDPLLNHIPELSETFFNSWEAAQIMRQWFGLQPGSPARGAGPNGRDLGGVIPIGVSVGGEPQGASNESNALLTLEPNRMGNGIPSAGWPFGSGFTHYKYRLDSGPWSSELPMNLPISLSGLAEGPHQVEVVGKNDAEFYQNDPVFGEVGNVSQSSLWNVDSSYSPPAAPGVRINEILASNVRTLTQFGATPDLIELYNAGGRAADLSGMGLTDNPGQPFKFLFPSGTTLAPGELMTLLADAESGGTFLHTGFGLNESGDELWLFDAAERGGQWLDAISFGVQTEDYSIGRLNGGVWGLCRPTFGESNIAQRTGDPGALRINEWLADAQFTGDNDFIEIYNPGELPVAMGGLHLSDAAGSPERHRIADLSFIGGRSFAEFIADGQPDQGADHLSFKLDPEVGVILLSSAELTLIDSMNYGPQTTDASQGRTPNGGDTIAAFPQPTPGASNPGTATDDCTVTTVTLPLLSMLSEWRYNETDNLDGVPWTTSEFDDSNWPSGPALLGVESSGLPSPGIQTDLNLGRLTYYFRTHFNADTNLDGFQLNIRTILDDGAIVYLNGARILSQGMDSGPAQYSTLASRSVGNASAEFLIAPGDALVEGDNVLAVEAHQTSANSSDIVWGMEMEAELTTTNCAPDVRIQVALNEIMAKNRTLINLNGAAADYLELYNYSTNVVDMSGLSLTDDPSSAGKWIFADGTLIDGRASQVIYFEGNQPASDVNTGFNLPANGGVLYLFNAPERGGALIDSIRYGIQVPDFTIGRVPDGEGDWELTAPSPGEPNMTVSLANPLGLRVNEWMADPAKGEDWFELFNDAAEPVALGGLFLTDDPADWTASPIPPLSFIGGGGDGFARFIADGNPVAGADHANFKLSRTGETIGLYSADGTELDTIAFGDQDTAVSEGRFRDGASTAVRFPFSPSPGESNYLPLENAVINEVLTHCNPPMEDAIELFNPTAASANIGGWYLSDSKSDLKKFRIPDGAVLEPFGFQVFYEAQFNAGSDTSFTFNGSQDGRAILSQTASDGRLTGYRDEVQFGAAERNVSFGRHPTSAGVDFTAMSAPTFGVEHPATLQQFRQGEGLQNASPRIGSIVISEIMYHPADGGLGNGDGEYLELENLSDDMMALYNPENPYWGWRLANAVEFEFPRNSVLPARSRAIVVGFDPLDATRLAAFRSLFGIPPGIPVFGPWNGRLDNDGETIELLKPGAVELKPPPDSGIATRVLADKVSYLPNPPWPFAGGDGYSLQRIPSGAYGNDPVNWTDAGPTPGRPNAADFVDLDDDGMDDAWEQAFFGTLTRTGDGDFDGDGFRDLDEYLSGSNPNDELWVELAFDSNSGATLIFNALAGREYRIDYRDSLNSGVWRTLEIVPPPASNGPILRAIEFPLTDSRFFRIAAMGGNVESEKIRGLKAGMCLEPSESR